MIFPLLKRALDSVDDGLDDRVDREAVGPVEVFFRDDDAGWADDKLLGLCDVFSGRAPLDLAVIPLEIDARLASDLLEHSAELGFHQHGYAHRNHQATGKKCELADTRPPNAIRQEIEAGQIRLRGLFGDRLDPIFTPPWNRCGLIAAETLVELGVRALSRDTGATPFADSKLIELPVAVDWVKLSRLGRSSDCDPWRPLDRALAEAIAISAESASPVGVMLHHEVMEVGDLFALDALVELLCRHRSVALRPMAELLAERGPVR